MANTVDTIRDGRQQFLGLFRNVIQVLGTVDFASIASNATGTETITVPGVRLGDICIASIGLDTNGSNYWAHARAANTIDLHLHNNTGGPIDLASCEYHVIILQCE